MITAAGGTPSAWTQMFGSGLIGVREGLETGIVVMVLLAFLSKAGRRDAKKWVWLGVGIAVTMVLAIFAAIHYGSSTIDGLAAETVAGLASLLAVVIVTGMVLWMKSASTHISGDLRAGLSKALSRGPLAITALAFLAVGREGLETALLMVGYAENSSGSSWPLVGLLGGIIVAVVATVLLYYGAIRINFAIFFRYTGLFLIVVAAGILAYGIGELQVVGWIPGKDTYAFDISSTYDQSSWYGTILAGIFNFRPEPTVAQVSAWAIYLAVVLTLFLLPTKKKKRTENADLVAA